MLRPILISIVLLQLFRITQINASNTDVVNRKRICNTKLLLAYVVFRHGDRAPEKSLLSYSEDPDRDTRLSYPYGLGGLTNRGKLRGYEVGQYLRKRYYSLLSDVYFINEIYLRSTDVERTKMTILAALAAMYPPSPIQKWNLALAWQPIPYTTVPAADDFMLSYSNCENFNLTAIFSSRAPELDDYSDILELVSELTNYSFVDAPVLIYGYFDLIISQEAIGVPPPEWLVPHMDRLAEAAGAAGKAIFASDQSRRLAGGVFLNEFLTTADAVIAGDNVTQLVRLYSAHDINVIAQMAASGVSYQRAKYGSVFSLELRRNKLTGNYTVAPLFLPQAGESNPIVLKVDGCGEICDYDKFKELTGKYALTDEERILECTA